MKKLKGLSYIDYLRELSKAKSRGESLSLIIDRHIHNLYIPSFIAGYAKRIKQSIEG